MLMMNLIYMIEQKALVNMLYIVNYSDTNRYFLFFYSSVLNPIPHGGGGQILPSFRLSSLSLSLGMQQNYEIW